MGQYNNKKHLFCIAPLKLASLLIVCFDTSSPSGQEVCETPPDPTFGMVVCTPEAGGGKACTVSCQTGYRFQSQAAAQYRCDSNGNWSPAKDTIPNCVPGRLIKGAYHPQM